MAGILGRLPPRANLGETGDSAIRYTWGMETESEPYGGQPPRAEPSSNKFSSCELAQEQVANGLTDFESLSVSPSKGTLLELFGCWLTETENARAL